MERFKIHPAKRLLNHFGKNLDLKQLVRKLRHENEGYYVRACYHRYLDFKDRTLLHIMAIDGLFLLDLLQTYLKEEEYRSLFKGFPQLETFANGEKLTKDAITRDVIMLENQIPIHTMKIILSVLQSFNNGDSDSVDKVDEELSSMLLSFCEKHCPFQIWQMPTPSKALKHYHLLDLLYHLVLPEDKNTQFISEKQGETDNTESNAEVSHCQYCSMIGSKIQILGEKLKISSRWIMDFLGKFKNFNFPLVKPIKKLIEGIQNLKNLQSGLEVTSETKTPVIIMIPSVSELHKAGISFQPAIYGITSIEFDMKKGIFYLPVIRLDVNSEVIMRNMVAYEEMTKTKSFGFTRYTELMRAIIDTVEDVRLLKEASIISKDSTLSDKECEGLFNGMCKSIRPTKTPNLDETIKKVNKYYNHTRKVRAQRLVRKYVYSLWKLFTLLATLVLLVMTALQTFCSAYDCPRHLRTGTISS